MSIISAITFIIIGAALGYAAARLMHPKVDNTKLEEELEATKESLKQQEIRWQHHQDDSLTLLTELDKSYQKLTQHLKQEEPKASETEALAAPAEAAEPQALEVKTEETAEQAKSEKTETAAKAVETEEAEAVKTETASEEEPKQDAAEGKKPAAEATADQEKPTKKEKEQAQQQAQPATVG